jgi:hypothetical protein
MPELVRTYTERYINSAWSDISAYVVGDIEYEYLIPSNEENEKLASVGKMRLVMNNEDDLFSTNSNFHRGTPIRVRTVYDDVSKLRFLGTILTINPDTEETGDQYSRVTVVDWMNFAVDHPMIVPQIQTDMTVDDAVAYLLSQMDKQPESVVYHEGRETFEFVFDTIKKETKAYSELNKLSMSEFAPIYLRAGNVLVVESADTRNGTRELTQVPVNYSNSGRLLKEDGGFLLKEDGGKILLDQLFTPNFVSGTHTFTNIEVPEDVMLNRVQVRAYPARYDENNVLLYQLDVGALNIWTFGRVTIKGNWANPDGGEPINALTSSFVPMITGTNYVAFSDMGEDISQNLIITERYGSEGFEHTIFNNGINGFITKFSIFGKGIYPYNPVETVANITGSIGNYGISQLTIDQKYQDGLVAGQFIMDSILDRDKEPRKDVKSITFEASSDNELMQTSQVLDTGDLVWVKNVKPAVDTYCYIQGRKTVITPAGWVTEKFYLKEMDSLRNGLTPIALRFSGLNPSKNAVSFGAYPKHGSGGPHTWSMWFYMRDGASTAPLMSKTNVNISSNNSNDIFTLSSTKQILVRRAFSNGGSTNAGVWASATGTLNGLQNDWHHVAMVYDDSSASNDPLLYLDGVSLPLIEADTPEGVAVDYDNADLVLGNLNVVGAQFLYNFNGYQKDVRIYERFLEPSEVLLLATNENGWQLVPDGLVFQAPAVRTEDYGNLTGTALYPQNKVLDNIFGIVGTPTWNYPSGTAWAIKAYDPNF